VWNKVLWNGVHRRYVWRTVIKFGEWWYNLKSEPLGTIAQEVFFFKQMAALNNTPISMLQRVNAMHYSSHTTITQLAFIQISKERCNFIFKFKHITLFSDLFDLEDGGATVLEGVGSHGQVYAAYESRKFKPFKTLYLWRVALLF